MKVITGRLLLSMDNPADFVSSTKVRGALQEGIATAIPGVEADMVRIGIVDVSAVRRLADSHALAGEVTVTYEIRGRSLAKVTAASVMAAGGRLRTGINRALADAGLEFAVEAVAVPEPTVAIVGLNAVAAAACRATLAVAAGAAATVGAGTVW